ncbi:hypothetical protein [Desulfovibrio sp. TomC]|uniref:hypothetical protein n=1 Tax=Desulfovibrio sp. TomC TaxID=1562888 RepID=UPI000574F292|nr:hypothetical protein [Desulfovibrio sp. TomC]KHK03144.1 hypothetical protein NY78_1208 [Desulfovibrio sp. TomC]
MKTPPLRHGRPLPVLGAIGFAGAALLVLIGREICGAYPDHTAIVIVLALVCLGLGLFLGTRLVRRLSRDSNPADCLAPAMGLVAVALPAALLLSRLERGFVSTGSGTFLPPGLIAGLAAGLLPLGVALGAAAVLAAAAAGQSEPGHPRKTLLFLAGGAVLGALFIPLVAVPKLSPINACLDMAIGCTAVGLLSAAAAPADNRKYETWLSLLAITFVLLLPLSGLFDDKTSAWCRPDAVATAPAAPTTPAP